MDNLELEIGILNDQYKADIITLEFSIFNNIFRDNVVLNESDNLIDRIKELGTTIKNKIEELKKKFNEWIRSIKRKIVEKLNYTVIEKEKIDLIIKNNVDIYIDSETKYYNLSNIDNDLKKEIKAVDETLGKNATLYGQISNCIYLNDFKKASEFLDETQKLTEVPKLIDVDKDPKYIVNDDKINGHDFAQYYSKIIKLIDLTDEKYDQVSKDYLIKINNMKEILDKYIKNAIKSNDNIKLIAAKGLLKYQHQVLLLSSYCRQVISHYISINLDLIRSRISLYNKACKYIKSL